MKEEKEKGEDKEAIARLIKEREIFPWISEKPKADVIILINQSRENSYQKYSSKAVTAGN